MFSLGIYIPEVKNLEWFDSILASVDLFIADRFEKSWLSKFGIYFIYFKLICC